MRSGLQKRREVNIERKKIGDGRCEATRMHYINVRKFLTKKKYKFYILSSYSYLLERGRGHVGFLSGTENHNAHIQFLFLGKLILPRAKLGQRTLIVLLHKVR